MVKRRSSSSVVGRASPDTARVITDMFSVRRATLSVFSVRATLSVFSVHRETRRREIPHAFHNDRRKHRGDPTCQNPRDARHHAAAETNPPDARARDQEFPPRTPADRHVLP
jgi:hypothetical protein